MNSFMKETKHIQSHYFPAHLKTQLFIVFQDDDPIATQNSNISSVIQTFMLKQDKSFAKLSPPVKLSKVVIY